MAPRPLRVLALIDSLVTGGAENLLVDFATGAPQHGIDLSVAHLDPTLPAAAATGLRRLGIEAEHVEVTSLLRHHARARVRALVAQAEVDLVHTHLGSADFLGCLAARSLGIPAISTLHSAAGPNGAANRVRALMMAAARRRGATRLIAVSEAARSHYLSFRWERPERVVTVHNGIAGSVNPGVGREIRAELGIEPDAMVVAMVSILRPGKGHELAIDSIRELRERHGRRVVLLALGDGSLREEIAGRMADLGDQGKMLGHRDDVLDVLDASDVLIHPSSADAFPGALLEAMAARLPVVASAVGGIPEIVVPGETGLLIPAPPRAADLTRALEGLLGDPAARERMGAAGRERFEREFTLDAWFDRLLPVYREALMVGGDRSDWSSDSSTGT